MKQLTHSHRINLTEYDKRLITELKKYKVKPTTFIRQAFREKIKREMPTILRNEEKRRGRKYCPF